MLRNYIALFAFLISSSICVKPQNVKHEWKIYTNARFGYSICYPKDIMLPQGEAPNSDGQRFLGKDGATLLVFGKNALGETLLQDEESTKEYLRREFGPATYQIALAHFYVLSGKNSTSLFYTKTMYSDDQLKSFLFTYPVRDTSLYNEIAGHIAHCFVDLHQLSDHQ